MHRLVAVSLLMSWPAAAIAQDVIGAMGPRPRNDRSSWVTRTDFPLIEYAKGTQGTTAFAVTVGADGRPKSCEILHSSGSPILDRIVCERVTMRAWFYPARDVSGRKVEGRYRNRVHWTIPADQAEEVARIKEIVARQQVSPAK